MQKELNNVYTALRTLKIPVAYRLFKSKPESIPFCVYYLDNRDQYGADDLNMLERRTVVIELYTEKKEIELENKLLRLFKDEELDISETYIDDEKLFMQTISFETVLKLKEE